MRNQLASAPSPNPLPYGLCMDLSGSAWITDKQASERAFSAFSERPFNALGERLRKDAMWIRRAIGQHGGE